MIKKSKKHIIIEEAARLFREKGYSATTMRDLAAQVGMEAASLYNHIKSKEEILNEICFSLARTYSSKMQEVYYSDYTPISKIKKLIALHIQINSMSSPLATVMNDEWKHLTEPCKTEFLDMRKKYEYQFIDIIQQGIDKGEIKNMNPRIALYTLLSSVRWLQHWYHANQEHNVNDIKKNIMELFLSGMIENQYEWKN
ncbi:TetR/AcrR family transcriptional regulator [Reichenbachiella agarivorans]|uniref:TetR/AcrR family transcriptional regulator n=1 Tax=Reichenbachiella agarivorans TaxID=2979464 RepID=A0ABY6CK25_9BACT|nr:TetR/AcrR family transcriptional regulator [Reichenbachiella agarivorans]UXP30876.1 TetR/AcrR family transcriptional regulator [Reichenbachiella agarivorans]